MSALPRLKVGFIGLGAMGSAMSANLLKAGLNVVVQDVTSQQSRHLEGMGADVASSPAEISSMAGLSACFTMLPSPSAVQDVYAGKQGLLAGGHTHCPLFVDCSTSSPILAQQIAARIALTRLHPQLPPMTHGPIPHAPHATAGTVIGTTRIAASEGLREGHNSVVNTGINRESDGALDREELAEELVKWGTPEFVDAPVSGGVLAAQDASLTFLCGGSPTGVAAAQALLRHMGSRFHETGGHGSGQAAKICNNLVLAISMAAVSEGLVLGEQLGLSPAALSAVLNTSSGRCWSSDSYNPAPGVMPNVPASRDYEGGFANRLMLKDIGLAIEAGAAHGQRLPLCHASDLLYRQASLEMGQNKDFASVFQVYKNMGKRE